MDITANKMKNAYLDAFRAKVTGFTVYWNKQLLEVFEEKKYNLQKDQKHGIQKKREKNKKK